MSSVNTCHRTFQIDVTAVARVIGVFKLFSRCIISSITDRTILATTKHLEYVTLVDIDSGTAPYLRVATITATKHVEGLT